MPCAPLIGRLHREQQAISLAKGVSLAVAADGPGARLTLRSIRASGRRQRRHRAPVRRHRRQRLTVGTSGPPSIGLETHVGLDGDTPGRQAVYARLGNAGLRVFLRPATGADIRLLPFAGLGSLSDAAAAATFLLLDRLAEIAGTPGDLVRTLGDALALRKGSPTRSSTPMRCDLGREPGGGAHLCRSIVSTTNHSLRSGVVTTRLNVTWDIPRQHLLDF